MSRVGEGSSCLVQPAHIVAWGTGIFTVSDVLKLSAAKQIKAALRLLSSCGRVV